MKRMDYRFLDRVSGKMVFRFRDRLGRYWLATNSWAKFRVRLDHQ